MNLKRFFSNWQGLAALIVAGAVLWVSPWLLRLIDPGAGAFDAGYLQRPIVAASYFFFATFCAWTALQIDFPTINAWIDQKNFRDAWNRLEPRDRILFAGILFVVLLAAFIACLMAVPLPV